MATYIVTTSSSGIWEDDWRNQFKTRRSARARVAELLGNEPVVRVVKWECGKCIDEERFEASGGDRLADSPSTQSANAMG